MNILPNIRVARFDSLSPGDLFLVIDSSISSFAFKTTENSSVILGPKYPYNLVGPTIIPSQLSVVMSYGHDISIIISNDPNSWSSDPAQETCLAVSENRAYICVNGIPSPSEYFRCFVDLKTGEIFESLPQGPVAYCKSWEFAFLDANKVLHKLLKFPIQQSALTPPP